MADTAKEPLRAVKGMNDILPPESSAWQQLESTIRSLMHRHGYGEIRTPIVEPTALFVRGLGEVTDIVEKEMYSFEDSLNGDRLSLRPENTAGVVRAAIEHSLLHDGGKRLYYIGPMFRHERPQKGRSRQFHQFGAEAMGYPGPDVDAEMLLMLRALWRELGLEEGRDYRLELNSLGAPSERRAHRAALVAYLEQHRDALDEDSQRRLHTNPLRVLDSKNPAMQSLIEGAPKLIEHLGAESMKHFDGLRSALHAAGVPYRLNPRLVRGLDYYGLTVFEWVTDRLGAQGTICGGGRYDGLFEMLGGKPAQGVGFGMGLERVLLLMHEAGRHLEPRSPDVFAIVPDESSLARALAAVDALRAAGHAVVMNAGYGSMKAQFRRADASGARYALIFGADELARGEAAIKPLRDDADPQTTRPLDGLVAWASGALSR